MTCSGFDNDTYFQQTTAELIEQHVSDYLSFDKFGYTCLVHVSMYCRALQAVKIHYVHSQT